MQTVDHLANGVAGPVARRLRHWADQHHRPERHGIEQGSQRIGTPGRRCIGIAAQRWPDDRPGLPHHRRYGDGVRQHGRRHQIGRERAIGRPVEGPRDPHDHGDAKDQRQADPALIGGKGQQPRRQRQRRQRRARNHPPIIMVRNPAGDRRQEEERQKLRQPDQPQLRRRARRRHRLPRNIIGLPTQHDHHAILRQHRRTPPDEIGPEIGEMQRVAGQGRGGHGQRFSRLRNQ